MTYLLVHNKTFEEAPFDVEAELENAVVNNKIHIFGNTSVLINYRRKTGIKNSKNTGVPDGFLIDFSDNKKPKLFFVEYELESHDLYGHIGQQIMRFYASFETGKRELHKKLIKIIKNDIGLGKEIDGNLQKTNFDNFDSLLNYLIFDSEVGIIVIIDEQDK